MSQNNSTHVFRGSPTYYEQVHGTVFGERLLDCLSINLPPACNFRCDFCFVHEEPTSSCASPKPRPARRVLDLALYSTLIRDAAELGVRHLEISGEGEPDLPMFRQALCHIIEQATQRGIHTCLFVNGFLLDEAFLRFLQAHNTSLVISMKYFDAEKYERSVGVRGAYRRVLQHIKLARHIFGEPDQSGSFIIHRLAINGTILDDNEEDSVSLRTFCDENGLFFHLATRISQGMSAQAKVDHETQEALSRQQSHGSIIFADSAKKQLGVAVCGTFYYGIGIGFDGDVLFDAHALDTHDLIGNVFSIGLFEAVRRHRLMRDAFYARGGSLYCPLRDPTYSTFVRQWREAHVECTAADNGSVTDRLYTLARTTRRT